MHIAPMRRKSVKLIGLVMNKCGSVYVIGIRVCLCVGCVWCVGPSNMAAMYLVGGIAVSEEPDYVVHG